MKTKIGNETKAELVAAAQIAGQRAPEQEFWREVERLFEEDDKESGLVEKRDLGTV